MHSKLPQNSVASNNDGLLSFKHLWLGSAEHFLQGLVLEAVLSLRF